MSDSLLWLIHATASKQKDSCTVPRLSRKALEASRASFAAAKERGIALDSETGSFWKTEFARAAELGVTIVAYNDPAYPQALREGASPPPALYVRGSLDAVHASPKLVVVGTRRATDYGITLAFQFAQAAAESGFCVLSGGAVGVDGAAHRGALTAGGKTVVLLGCGIDVDYPAEHTSLFERVVQQGGAVVSEFSFGTPPLPENFPRRNRLFPALGHAVFVPEAPLRSGALITADYAANAGIPVFVAPGNVTSMASAGSNELLRDGASLALSPLDVLEAMALCPTETTDWKQNMPAEEPPAPTKEAPSSDGLVGDEARIYDLIRRGTRTFDALLASGVCDEVRLGIVLNMLELRALIRRGFGREYELLRDTKGRV